MPEMNAEAAQEIVATLTPSEQSVLGVFRRYLMTPRLMLCFHGADLERYRTPLAKLVEKGLIVSERFRGGYSLTVEGFAAMKACARQAAAS
mgnify:CR=1 FL=1